MEYSQPVNIPRHKMTAIYKEWAFQADKEAMAIEAQFLAMDEVKLFVEPLLLFDGYVLVTYYNGDCQAMPL